MALDTDPPDRVPSEAEIQEIERQLGFPLPDCFRASLPQLNGAEAEPNVIKGPGDEDYAINRFEKIEDIVDSKNAIDSENPSDLLLVPFAWMIAATGSASSRPIALRRGGLLRGP